MAFQTLGLLHPGEMGATLGGSAKQNVDQVLWVSSGRSELTRQRADNQQLHAISCLADLVEQSQVILAICPPHGAMALAQSVANLGFGGTYLDANALSPVQSRRIGEFVSAAGATFVDGSVIGPPAHRAGTTRLYLSGSNAGKVAEIFARGHVEAKVISDDIGAASALKMAYAAWTKGTDALLMAIRALAQQENVGEALLAEWALSQPDLAEKSLAATRGSAPKAWRFVAEMHQIADSFETLGLPDGFHRAAADVYNRLDGFKDQFDPGPGVDEVVKALLSYDKSKHE